MTPTTETINNALLEGRTLWADESAFMSAIRTVCRGMIDAESELSNQRKTIAELEGQLSEVLIDVDSVGYYGENIDSAMQCWRETVKHERERNRELERELATLRKALEESNTVSTRWHELLIAEFGLKGELLEQVSALREEANRLKSEIENADHTPNCDSLKRTVHVEPCPFWTKNYCLMEKCTHGVLMGDACDKCPGPGTVLFGAERCHAGHCNCFKKALADPPCSKPACIKCNGTNRVIFDEIRPGFWGARPAKQGENAVDCPDCAPPCNTCGGNGEVIAACAN